MATNRSKADQNHASDDLKSQLSNLRYIIGDPKATVRKDRFFWLFYHKIKFTTLTLTPKGIMSAVLRDQLDPRYLIVTYP